MTGHGAKFGRKMEEAIAALLSHRTIDEAAHSINIAPKTLLRWLRLPEFKAAYLQTRRAPPVSAPPPDGTTTHCGLHCERCVPCPAIPAVVGGSYQESTERYLRNSRLKSALTL
jgi:hypothetical protein